MNNRIWREGIRMHRDEHQGTWWATFASQDPQATEQRRRETVRKSEEKKKRSGNEKWDVTRDKSTIDGQHTKRRESRLWQGIELSWNEKQSVRETKQRNEREGGKIVLDWKKRRERMEIEPIAVEGAKKIQTCKKCWACLFCLSSFYPFCISFDREIFQRRKCGNQPFRKLHNFCGVIEGDLVGISNAQPT